MLCTVWKWSHVPVHVFEWEAQSAGACTLNPVLQFFLSSLFVGLFFSAVSWHCLSRPGKAAWYVPAVWEQSDSWAEDSAEAVITGLLNDGAYHRWPFSSGSATWHHPAVQSPSNTRPGHAAAKKSPATRWPHCVLQNIVPWPVITGKSGSSERLSRFMRVKVMCFLLWPLFSSVFVKEFSHAHVHIEMSMQIVDRLPQNGREPVECSYLKEIPSCHEHPAESSIQMPLYLCHEILLCLSITDVLKSLSDNGPSWAWKLDLTYSWSYSFRLAACHETPYLLPIKPTCHFIIRIARQSR